MYSRAPTRLERFGAISCAHPLAPSRRGLRPPGPLPKSASRARSSRRFSGGSGGAVAPLGGRRRGRAGNRSK
eukprot:10476003-Alexandrium_andersonii.AAC.1